MSNARPAHAVTISAKVGFQHCDPLGVVWHGRYFEWLEAARNELFASCALDIPQIRALGHRMYVVDARCRYMAPLAYGDTAHVTAWFREVAPMIRVAYDVRDAPGGRWCARAHTVLAVTDGEGRMLATTPESMLARLPRVTDGGSDDT
jgi:acyl-CoA thioester hydrolase